ncbi:GerMN domain-containing protein [Actinomyces sp. oral taxon 448]|uniref:GerMN domain-containing protein n=1 Tax=Actinomyces sp. oral taxon 448 TaxID=712124 RepID=UPI000218871F|nr:GerMN domain-containing protein [Actinomyces sp. oral taxon 448]EGQ73004.1 hypothetical protein HMPREF9062_2267 [Actinomyces sp. oral taxon 448 str. F0400]
MSRGRVGRTATRDIVPRRTVLAALASGGGLVALAGCADLPTDGQVTSSDVVSAHGSQLVQTAARPRDGAGPEEIVAGFLRACVAGFSDDFATARTFLHRAASDAWEPTSVVRAYTGSTAPVVERDESGAVKVTVELVRSIDSSGVLTSDGAAQSGSTDGYTAFYSLATDSLGQWRIVDLPPGVLLPTGSLQTNFMATSLYFLTPDRARLVPELRWLPRGDLPTSTLVALLGGPADWLAPGVASALPREAGLAADGVVLEDGTATVALDGAVAELDSQERALAVAQLAATLGRLEGVSSVVVTADGESMGDPVPLPQPDAPVDTVIGMSAGSVVRGTSSTRRTLATVQALGTAQARHPVLGPDEAVYALSASSLLRLRPGEDVASVIASVGAADAGEGGLLAPVVDRYGWAWTAADGVLTAVGDLGQRAPLSAQWLEGREVTALDLSAESARLVLRHRDGEGGDEHVSAAVVVRAQDGTPTGLGRPLALPQAAGEGVTGLAWYDPVNVVVLAPGRAEQEPPGVRYVQVGGASTDVAGTPGATALTADRASGTALLTDDRGQAWQRKGATWRVLTTEVFDLSYPLP